MLGPLTIASARQIHAVPDAHELVAYRGDRLGPAWVRRCGAPILALGEASDHFVTIDAVSRLQRWRADDGAPLEQALLAPGADPHAGPRPESVAFGPDGTAVVALRDRLVWARPGHDVHTEPAAGERPLAVDAAGRLLVHRGGELVRRRPALPSDRRPPRGQAWPRLAEALTVTESAVWILSAGRLWRWAEGLAPEPVVSVAAPSRAALRVGAGRVAWVDPLDDARVLSEDGAPLARARVVGGAVHGVGLPAPDRLLLAPAPGALAAVDLSDGEVWLGVPPPECKRAAWSGRIEVWLDDPAELRGATG